MTTEKAEISGWSGTRIFEILFPKKEDEYDLLFKVSKYHEIIKFGNPNEFLSSAGILRFHDVFNVEFNFAIIKSTELYIDHIEKLATRPTPNGKFTITDFKVVMDNGHIDIQATEISYEISIGPLKTNQMYIIP